jgi:hypothetical protein
MNKQDFTVTLIVDQTPEQAFDAINNVRGWWSEEIKGGTSQSGDIFDYHYQDIHSCRMKIVELVPNKKVVWLVEDNYFKFTEDKSEWIGNKIIFDISDVEGKTEIKFTQVGLVPAYECYKICHDAWSGYLKNSLIALIATGRGMPNAKEVLT